MSEKKPGGLRPEVGSELVGKRFEGERHGDGILLRPAPAPKRKTKSGERLPAWAREKARKHAAL